MKKWIALLLALVMAFTLIACAKNDAAPSDETPANDNSTADTKTDDNSAEKKDTFKMAWLHNAADQWHHQTALVCKEAIENHFDNVEVTLFDSKADAAEIQPFLERCISEGDWDLVMYGTLSDDSDYIKQLEDMGTTSSTTPSRGTSSRANALTLSALSMIWPISPPWQSLTRSLRTARS